MILTSKIIGTGSKTIVILHGFLGMSSNWNSYAKKISLHGFTSHLVDLRNHGDSFHSAEFSYDFMADDLNCYAIENNIEKFSLIGHSMGGKTAMMFSLKYPDKVESMIIVDILPKAYDSGLGTILNALKSIELSKISSRGQADILLMNEIKDKSMRGFLLKNLSKKTDKSFFFKCNIDILHKKIYEIEKAIVSKNYFKNKTLFIKGASSDYVNYDGYISAKKLFPNSKLISIENAGHWVHAENPKIFFEKTLIFLKN
tara:strand:- start:1552 stop:2322 length:771 start_codon:yes stop_codon:yes gene_type:complete